MPGAAIDTGILRGRRASRRAPRCCEAGQSRFGGQRWPLWRLFARRMGRYGGRRASPGDLTYGAHGDTSGPYGRTVGFCGRAAGFRGPTALADALSALQARCRLPRTHCRLLRTHCRLFGRAAGSCGGAGGRAASLCGAVPDSVLEPGGARSPPRHLGRSVRRPADQPVHRRVGPWPSARRGTGRAPDRPPNVPDLPVHPPLPSPRTDPRNVPTGLRTGAPAALPPGSVEGARGGDPRLTGAPFPAGRTAPVTTAVVRAPYEPCPAPPGTAPMARAPRGAERGHQDVARAVAGPGRRLASDRLRSRHASRDSSQARVGSGLRRRTWSRPGAAGAPPW